MDFTKPPSSSESESAAHDGQLALSMEVPRINSFHVAWAKQAELKLAGHKLGVNSKNSWHYTVEGKSELVALLLDKAFLYLYVHEFEPKTTLQDYVNLLTNDAAVMLNDASPVVVVELSAAISQQRQSVRLLAETLLQHAGYVLFFAPGLRFGLLSSSSQLTAPWNKKGDLVESLEDAFDRVAKARQLQAGQSLAGTLVTLEQVQGMSPEQLRTLWSHERSQRMKLEQAQKSELGRLESILKGLAQGKTFSKSEMRTDVTAFEPLFEALQSVKTSTRNMVSELQSLNTGLEIKVSERTKKLEEKSAELKKVNQELDNFVYSVSHDLRAPIASLLGLIQICQREPGLTDSLQSNLELQLSAVHKLDMLIKDIIDISRNARLPLTFQEIDFSILVEAIFEKFSQQNPTIKLEYSVETDINKPFYSDRKRLLMVLNNLISNSIRYRNEAAPSCKVGVVVKEVDEYRVSVAVSDNGKGISQEYQARIFDMFFRADESSKGSGLGLYIIRETVDKLKGTVELESTPGKGSTFTVTLPRLYQ